MTEIYLIRHAQAGSRDNYDVLSELGEEQARKLGEYLAAQRIELTAVYSGTMRRQRETAEIVCRALAQAGVCAPDILFMPSFVVAIDRVEQRTPLRQQVIVALRWSRALAG